MDNTLYTQQDKEIEVINIDDRIEGNMVLELKEFICGCIDANKRYLLLDMQGKDYVSKEGIDVFHFAKKRGMYVRLFNVCSTTVSERNGIPEDIIYDTSDIYQALDSFQKEIINTRNGLEMMKGRKYKREEVFLLSRFSWLNEQNVLISGKAQIINLSEDGMLTHEMVAVNITTGGVIDSGELAEKQYIQMKFCLNDRNQPVVVVGESIRITKDDETLSVGIHFKGITQEGRNRIKEYINKKQAYEL